MRDGSAREVTQMRYIRRRLSLDVAAFCSSFVQAGYIHFEEVFIEIPRFAVWQRC